MGKKEKKETSVELDTIQHVEKDKNPEDWKKKLLKDFHDVPKVLQTIEQNPNINFEAYYTMLKNIISKSSNEVLAKALTHITAQSPSPSDLINTALLLITLEFYPNHLLPPYCSYKSNKIPFDTFKRQVAKYLTSPPILNSLSKTGDAMPASIYHLADATPPKHAPTDIQMFPWLRPIFEVTDDERKELNLQSKVTLMPKPTPQKDKKAKDNNQNDFLTQFTKD